MKDISAYVKTTKNNKKSDPKQMKITGYTTWDPIYTGDGKKFKKAAHKRSLISKQNSFELAAVMRPRTRLTRVETSRHFAHVVFSSTSCRK